MSKRFFSWLGNIKPATFSKVLAVVVIAGVSITLIPGLSSASRPADEDRDQAMVTETEEAVEVTTFTTMADIRQIQCDSNGNVPLATVKSYLGNAIKATVHSNGTAFVTNNTSCKLPVSLASYKMFDTQLATQKIFDFTEVHRVHSGSKKKLYVKVPDCMAQIDLYYGEAAQQLDNANSAGHRTLAWAYKDNEGVGFADARGNFCTHTQTPPPPPHHQPLVCTPATQSVKVNEDVTVTATGGVGNFMWTATGGQPESGSGASFTTKYATAGSKTIVVKSGHHKTATCSVEVAEVPTTTTVTAAKTGPATVNRGQELTYQIVANNTGNLEAKEVVVTDEVMIPLTYVRASGAACTLEPSARTPRGEVRCDLGTIAAGQNKSVSLTFKVDDAADCQTVIHNKAVVSLENGNAAESNTVTTTVNCPTPELVCTPASQTVLINENASFNATGGTGTYAWTATGGIPASGNGASFTTKYDSTGSKTVTVASGDRTANCAVTVNQPTSPPPPSGGGGGGGSRPRLRIDKQVRNVTKSGGFADSVTAQRGEVVEFRIEIRNTGNASARDLHLTDVLSNDTMLNNFGNLSVSMSSTGNLIRDGLRFERLRSDESITITYRNNISGNAPAGQVCNTATVDADNASKEDDKSCVNVALVAGGNVSLAFSKKAWNNTKNKDATTVVANREDFITYTLSVSNSGNSDEKNFVITDDLSGVLPLADMIDTGGGQLNGNVLTYPAITIPAGNTVVKQFRVRVKFGLASNISYVMKNTYGNTVNVTINNPVAFVAPKTGGPVGTFAAIGFAGLLTFGFALHQKKSFRKMIFG